jgi:hypothetical protein
MWGSDFIAIQPANWYHLRARNLIMSGGPILMLDKCALQALSAAEVAALPRCFTINVPPILTLEILADLKKEKGLGKHGDSQKEVQTLADKLLGLFDHENNAHYRVMMEGELVLNCIN